MTGEKQPRDLEVMKPYRRRLISHSCSFLTTTTVSHLIRDRHGNYAWRGGLCTAQLSDGNETGQTQIFVKDVLQVGEQTAINLVCRRRNQQTRVVGRLVFIAVGLLVTTPRPCGCCANFVCTCKQTSIKGSTPSTILCTSSPHHPNSKTAFHITQSFLRSTHIILLPPYHPRRLQYICNRTNRALD
jgi:hypothetical protein